MYPAPGWIRMYWGGRTPGILDFLLGPEPPTVTDGYSRFSEIERPKRKSVIEYDGTDLYKMNIGGVFDRWQTNSSIENLCVRLERLVRMPDTAVPRFPQSFKMLGPVPHRNLRFYIASIDWGEAIYTEQGRVRQAFSLSLVERLDMPATLGNERLREFRRWRTVTSKTGDLRELAQLTLGESTLWRRFRNVKGRPFRDWKQRKGVKVRIPT